MTRPLASHTEESHVASNGREDVSASRPAIGQSTDLLTHDDLPPLARDVSFWGMAATQFLGAFNDNLFKQLILLLATPTAAQIAAKTATDVQGIAQIVFAGSFLIFSGVAGYLADRHSKRTVIVLAKVAEIVVMLLGMIGFLYYGVFGLIGLMAVLFLMGSQSAFFGPAKYGILPEMLRPRDLPRANGIFLMLTFLAIIFGTAAAGFLLTDTGGRVWLGSLVCVAIAVVGTMTSLIVRRVPVAQPGLKHTLACWGISGEILQLLRRDRQLMWAIVVVSIFWMVGGIVQQTVNALGKTQLQLTDRATSILAASIGLGIAVGCVVGGYLSRGRVNANVVFAGAMGLFITLIMMSLPGGQNQHLLGYRGSIGVLVLMGVFTGMFIVPVQVALQSRPPREQKGRMIATMNQFSWIGIILGAIVYQTCIYVLDRTGWPRSSIFAVAAVLMLPVALFYRPKDEALAG
jgi:acyl-[acyl-carrier-protein]-phospholipid O-acyltransferase/long-chain-fatty-acid--[acyl-carrier-protein] ligase